MDDEDLPDVHFESVRRPIFRKDRHLSSALLTSEIDYMLENRANPKALKKEHRDLLDRIEAKNAQIMDSVDFLPWCMKSWKNFSHTNEPVTQLTTAIRVAQHALRVSLLDYTGDSFVLPCVPSQELVFLFRCKRNLDKVMKKITFSTEFHQTYNLGKYTCDAYGNLHLIWSDSKTCWLVTHSHVVCVRDMINSWFDACLYSLIYPNKYPSFDFHRTVMECLEAGRKLIADHGRPAYKVLKMWPSLTIACILRDTEAKPELLATLLEEVSQYRHTDFYKFLMKPITGDIDVQLRLELSGLWKCFGHPNIDMTASVSNWIKKGAAGKGPCQEMSDKLVWAFRLEFCRQYYKKNRRWPVLQVTTRAPDKIKRNYMNNMWEEDSTHPWIPEDFRYVQLGKNLDFDYHIDISDLLSDKSIIPALEQWIHEFDKQAHRTNHGRFPTGPPPTSKSVVVHYLGVEYISVKDIIDQIQKGDIPLSWRVMVAVAKEREFKYLDARFYCKMCFEMRLYQTATEKNIADHVFRYIKNQSMTMSEEQLTRTILRMNTPVVQIEGETYVFIVLDFSSWCTHFRAELVQALFEELDRLFGLQGVYSFTHLFPLISYLLFQDRFCPPQQGEDALPRQGPRCYPFPEAWMEGLRQKGWTLATILIILLASWLCGTSASLLGQGDNQVILLRIPPLSYLHSRGITRDEYINNFLAILRDLCDKAKIVIKIEETWYSRNLFEYSRKYHYKGAQVSGCCKRVTRLASEANQVIPSLSGDLAGIFSTGIAAAAEDSTPMYTYFCTIVEACLHLWADQEWLLEEPWEYTCCLLMVTRCLGGYPVTIYSQFCTRAVQDVLSTNLHLVRTIAQDRILGDHIGRAITLSTSGHRDFLSLIKDPQSLPLDIPVQPENYVKREVKKGLEDFVVNKEVKFLFSIDAEEAQKKLVSDLSLIRPCNPKLLNKLYSLSNVGLQERWSTMFANTRSIQQLAFKSWSNELDVILAVRGMDEKFGLYLRRKKSDPHLEDIKNTECVTVYTQFLREKAWGIPMEGITMPPQQEQTRLVHWNSITPELASRAILIAEQDQPCLHKQTGRGKYTPYFGSQTQLRAKRALMQVVEVGSLVSSLKQLVELYGWVKGNEALTHLIEGFISEKTTLSIDDLTSYTRKVYSGSITHRLPCPAMRRGGMANQNLNHSSFYTITSDTATEFSKGGVNYTICFQSVYLYGLSVLAHKTELDIVMPKKTGLLFTCSKCTWIIPTETFDLEAQTYTGLPLNTKITELHHKDLHERYPLHTSVDEHISYAVIMARKLAFWIVNRRLVDKITSLDNRILEESVTLSFINLAEFSRLQVPLFLNSFVFYCMILDPLFFLKQYDYYNEILEGTTKNPYDVLLESLHRCGHMRSLCTMQRGPQKAQYSPPELRMLLFNILTEMCEDYKSILNTAYLLTPEDTLDTVVRAIQVWSLINNIPCTLTTAITREELDSVLKEKYSMYPSILPVCTLPEEETIYLIRGLRIETFSGTKILLPVTLLDQPSVQHHPSPYEGSRFFHIVNEDPVASALMEISSYPNFIQATRGLHLVTLQDKNGLYYTTLYHKWFYEPGYPHWESNEDWEKDPIVIACDRCPIMWDKSAYYCNGPKTEISTYEECLIVIPSKTVVTFFLSPGTKVLQRFDEPTRPRGIEFRSRSFSSSTEVWVLFETHDLITKPTEHVYDVSLLNPNSSLSSLRPVLLSYLENDLCLSPFASVTQLLGCLPKTPSSLIIALKTRVRKLLQSWRTPEPGMPFSYEGAIAKIRRRREDRMKFQIICTCHIVYNIVKKKPWHALGLKGSYHYHIHRRGDTPRVCWKPCRQFKYSPIKVEDLPVATSQLTSWLRYVWTILDYEAELHPSMPAPDIVFLPL